MSSARFQSSSLLHLSATFGERSETALAFPHKLNLSRCLLEHKAEDDSLIFNNLLVDSLITSEYKPTEFILRSE
jgi:hypothetical protein